MFFTRVPGLEAHIYAQQAKSIVYLLLAVGVYCSLPVLVNLMLHDTLKAETAQVPWPWLIGYWSMATAWAVYDSHAWSEWYVRAALEDTYNHLDDPRPLRLLDELWPQSGLSCRPLLVFACEERGYKASAAGSLFSGAHICLSPATLRLPDRELCGILAHELGHIKHRDHLPHTLLGGLAQALGYHLVILIGATLWIVGSSLAGYQYPVGTAWLLIEMTVGLLAVIVAFTLVAQAHSRAREYLADTFVLTLGKASLGDGFAQALARIRSERFPRLISVRSVLLGEEEPDEEMTVIGRYFRTHPSTQQRIAHLIER